MCKVPSSDPLSPLVAMFWSMGKKSPITSISASYQELKKQWDEADAQFSAAQQRIKKYPEEEEFKVDLLRAAEKRQELQKKLDDLKREVIHLAEDFTKISINTERLRLARQHFEAGDYPAARTILDAEQMGNELDALLQQKEHIQHQQAENEAHLLDRANEFLILARLTGIDFTLPNRFQQTITYFKQSLKAAHTVENTFAYAYFLQKNNQFKAAFPWYQEALALYRCLAETHPEAYQPDVAATLNNLGNLQSDQHDFAAAVTAYEEALAIRHRLAETHPEAYQPDVAMTAANLSIFYWQSVPDQEKSLVYAKEALISALPWAKSLPVAEKYVRAALQVAQAWGLDAEGFFNQAIQAMQSGKDKI